MKAPFARRCLWLGWLFLLVALLVVRIVAYELNLFHSTSSKSSNPVTFVDSAQPVSTKTALEPVGRRYTNFMMGMIFPQWGKSFYGDQNANWQVGLGQIYQQTNAQWVAMTLPFRQASDSATQVQVGSDTPSIAAFTEGIKAARRQGFKVAVMTMILVNAYNPWAGTIQQDTHVEQQAWFDSYWQVVKPYALVAQQEGVDQFSIGNEYSALEEEPDALWHQLIQRVSHAFGRRIVYCMNWPSLQRTIPTWMHDSNLTAIGVSMYVPLTDALQWLNPSSLTPLWHDRISTQLDAFAQQLKKPLFLSELGYQNSRYAGYDPWRYDVSMPPDPAEQAALYDAAMHNLFADSYISGVFIWAWDVQLYSPKDTLAAQVIDHWYSSHLRA